MLIQDVQVLHQWSIDTFDLLPYGEDLVENDLLQAVREIITERIIELIDADFDALLRILYRIDIPEHQLKSAFKNNAPGDAPAAIADLIIQRQLQKIETRRLYQ